MIETAAFVCSICNEPSLDICVYCTKDTCRNHRCERCKRCSDCCECEVPLVEPAREPVVVAAGPELPAAEPEVAVAGPEVGDHSIAPEPEQETVLPAAPEASEEPDLNVPTPAVLESMTEQLAEPPHDAPAAPEPPPE